MRKRKERGETGGIKTGQFASRFIRMTEKISKNRSGICYFKKRKKKGQNTEMVLEECKKMKKILSAAVIMCAVILLGMTDQSTVNGASGAIVYNYLPVQSETNTQDFKVDWEHEHRNEGDSADSVTRTVSRTQSFTGSLSGETEINALAQKFKFKAEIGYGQSKTEQTSVTFTCDPRKVTICQYGSMRVVTKGTMQQWQSEMLISSRMVSAAYTYESASRKTTRSL